jgi:lipoyl-dependent peroxiredoxin
MNVLEKTLYTAVVTSTGGREGRVKSDDGALDLAVVPPKQMGGPGTPGSNPEQLFAAGYAACFGSALAVVARRQKITTGPVNITARVSLGPVGPTYGIAVELEIAVPGVPKDQAEALMRAAHEVCPYSNATRGNIKVDLRLA